MVCSERVFASLAVPKLFGLLVCGFFLVAQVFGLAGFQKNTGSTNSGVHPRGLRVSEACGSWVASPSPYYTYDVHV